MTTKKPTFKKLILDDLKAQGHHTIAAKIKSIRYESFSMGSSVDVDGVDLFKEEREILKSLLDDYTYGTFDPYTDCSGVKENTANKVRRAKYVHLNNEFSNPVKEKAIVHLGNYYGIFDDETAQEKRRCWYDTALWRVMSEASSVEDFNKGVA